MADFTVGLDLLGKRRTLRFPDMYMASNFMGHLRAPLLELDDRPLRIVDVGACVGGWTLAHLAVLPLATFDCFEPNPAAWPYFRVNTEWCKRVTLHKLAVSDHSGYVPMAADPDNMGKHSVATQGAPLPARRLDDVITGPVDLLKIDAEGHEMRVLAGALAILDDCRPLVLVEVLKSQMERGGWTEHDLVRFMVAHGYGGPKPVSGNDWLFTPKGRA